MKIEELVPILELCKKIPAGEFKGSVFVWRVPEKSCPLEDKFYDIFVRDRCSAYLRDKQIPAPTLQEILAELPAGVELTRDSEYFCALDMSNEEYGESAAIAAMKVWLKWKGIKE
jgi:hypothetical protein